MTPIDLIDDQIDEQVASTKLDANRFLDYLDLALAVQGRQKGPGYNYQAPKWPDEDIRVGYKSRSLMDYDPLDPVVEWGPRQKYSRPDRPPQTKFPLDSTPLSKALPEISDLRYYHPAPELARGSVVGNPYKKPGRQITRYDINGRPHYVINPSPFLYYVDRTGAIPCIRRRVRREVLFAKKKAKGYRKLRVWKKESYFIC